MDEDFPGCLLERATDDPAGAPALVEFLDAVEREVSEAGVDIDPFLALLVSSGVGLGGLYDCEAMSRYSLFEGFLLATMLISRSRAREEGMGTLRVQGDIQSMANSVSSWLKSIVARANPNESADLSSSMRSAISRSWCAGTCFAALQNVRTIAAVL